MEIGSTKCCCNALNWWVCKNKSLNSSHESCRPPYPAFFTLPRFPASFDLNRSNLRSPPLTAPCRERLRSTRNSLRTCIPTDRITSPKVRSGRGCSCGRRASAPFCVMVGGTQVQSCARYWAGICLGRRARLAKAFEQSTEGVRTPDQLVELVWGGTNSQEGIEGRHDPFVHFIFE